MAQCYNAFFFISIANFRHTYQFSLSLCFVMEFLWVFFSHDFWWIAIFIYLFIIFFGHLYFISLLDSLAISSHRKEKTIILEWLIYRSAYQTRSKLINELKFQKWIYKNIPNISIQSFNLWPNQPSSYLSVVSHPNPHRSEGRFYDYMHIKAKIYIERENEKKTN